MAYQNVGTPRIYIDYLTYAQAIGNIGWWGDIGPRYQNNSPEALMNPLRPMTFTQIPGINEDFASLCFFTTKQPMYGMNFYGLIGHNMAGLPVSPTFEFGQLGGWSSGGTGGDNIWLTEREPVDIINTSEDGRYFKPIYNGFSLFKFNEILEVDVHQDSDSSASGFAESVDRFYHYNQGSNWADSIVDYLGTEGDIIVGGVPICGRIFEFEHAPDMKLTMEREFDGIKKQKTSGGGDISNIMYYGPPNWPLSGNPWALNAIDENLGPGFNSPSHAGARVGRRKWKLQFSMLSDRKYENNQGVGLFSANESTTRFMPDTTDDAGYTTDDYTPSTESEAAHFKYDIFSDNSFISLVVNKTLGFTLPFIFQPDKNNNSPDQFCMAKIDAKSFKMTQTSFRKYTVSMTIREVW